MEELNNSELIATGRAASLSKKGLDADKFHVSNIVVAKVTAAAALIDGLTDSQLVNRRAWPY
jgi:hypothetical protein